MKENFLLQPLPMPMKQPQKPLDVRMGRIGQPIETGGAVLVKVRLPIPLEKRLQTVGPKQAGPCSTRVVQTLKLAQPHRVVVGTVNNFTGSNVERTEPFNHSGGEESPSEARQPCRSAKVLKAQEGLPILHDRQGFLNGNRRVRTEHHGSNPYRFGELSNPERCSFIGDRRTRCAAKQEHLVTSRSSFCVSKMRHSLGGRKVVVYPTFRSRPRRVEPGRILFFGKPLDHLLILNRETPAAAPTVPQTPCMWYSGARGVQAMPTRAATS